MLVTWETLCLPPQENDYSSNKQEKGQEGKGRNGISKHFKYSEDVFYCIQMIKIIELTLKTISNTAKSESISERRWSWQINEI